MVALPFKPKFMAFAVYLVCRRVGIEWRMNQWVRHG